MFFFCSIRAGAVHDDNERDKLIIYYVDVLGFALKQLFKKYILRLQCASNKLVHMKCELQKVGSLVGMSVGKVVELEA